MSEHHNHIPTPLSVLILEDRQDDAELMVHELRRAGFVPAWRQVATEADYLAGLESFPDLILADYALPQFGALRALQLLRRLELDIPFIIVSGSIGEDIAIGMLHEGATDYLLKDRLARLGSATTRALEQRHLREQKRRADQLLRESEQRFRSLIEQAPDGIALIDGDGKFQYLSPSTQRILGYESDQVLGRDPAELTHPEDLPGLVQKLHLVLQHPGYVFTAHYRFRHNDGSWRWLESTVSNLLAEPAVRAIVFNYRDITERKEAEQALQQQYNLLHAVIEGTSDIVYVKDSAGRFLLINSAGCQLFGRPAEEIIGKDAMIFEPQLLRQVATIHNQVMQRGDKETYEHSFTIQGITRMYLTTITPYRDQHGNIIGLIGISRDITERKQLEAQLFQVQKMESIGQLAGGIAHDFNNMLSAVIGCIGSAQDLLPHDSPAQQSLKTAEDAAWRATNLTRQLLAFARKQMVQPRVENLNTLVLNLDKILRRLISEDIELVVLPTPGLCQVKVDPSQIEQVIMNLVVNARDAMPNGGKLTIETTITTLETEVARYQVGIAPGEYATLIVKDTGCGMTEERKHRIFEPFFTTKDPGKGTGMGLAVCYGIIHQHGGTIEVESMVGKGTTFTVYLPRGDETVDDLFGEVDVLDTRGGNETILLVEDEPLVRGLTSRMLRKQGYTVLEASNGFEAMRVLQEHMGAAVDLLLTDVVMPQMSGKALAEHVVRIYPRIKVLFISGHATDVLVKQDQPTAATFFLAKPFTAHALAHKVRAALDTPDA
jgi:two-component system, cell cycle sensor histidine kinase and response regulator CckA